MLDFEQQANQAQALASLDEDWHLLEGESTTFVIFLSYCFSYTRQKPATHDSGVDAVSVNTPGENSCRDGRTRSDPLGPIVFLLVA